MNDELPNSLPPNDVPATNPLQDVPPAQVPEEVAPEPAYDPMSRKFAALAARNREIVQREQRLKLAETERAEFEQLRGYKQHLQKLAQEDPEGYLAEGGLSHAKMVEWYTTQGKTPNVDNRIHEKRFEDLQAENKKLAEKLDSVLGSMQQKEEAIAYETAKYLVASDPETYELTHLAGEAGIETVANVRALYAEKYGHQISLKDACDLTEEWYASEAAKWKTSKKIQSQFVQATSPAAPKPPDIKSKAPSTLSAAVTDAAPSRDMLNLTNAQKRKLALETVKFKGG